MVDFKGVHFPKEAILYAVFFYLRRPGSYRDLEEIMEERGAEVNHTILNRWLVKLAPLVSAQAQSRKTPTAKFGAGTKQTELCEGDGAREQPERWRDCKPSLNQSHDRTGG